MTSLDPNYKVGAYAGHNPYHDYLLKALKHFDCIKFTEDEEFWTLGGKEWCEWKFLEKKISFGPRSYHSIDWKSLDPISDERVVPYSNTNFFGMDKFWRCPRVINFDSTNMVARNSDIMGRVCDLLLKGMKVSNKISFNLNIMTSWSHVKRLKDEEIIDLHRKDVLMLRSQMRYKGYSFNHFDEAIWSPMEGRHTPMLSFHCLVTR